MSISCNYDFNSHRIRVVEIDGDPWFVAVDACKALSIVTPYMVYRRLSADEVSYRKQTAVGLPGGRDVAIVSESGLYRPILRSDKETAKPFQDWVTRVVLPAIREDGAYVGGENLLWAPRVSMSQFA